MKLNNVCRGHALRIAIGITALTFLLTTGVLANPVLVDNFSDNAINSSLWTGFARGYGPTYAETNQSLEVNIPSNSSNDPFWGGFGAGYKSIYSLRGDFDVQVDYNALIWPSTNGVRIGLGAYMTDPWVFFPNTFGNVERVSFGPVDRDFIGYPREVYLTAFSDYWNGNFYRETSDQSGTLRLVRSGGNLTGYYYSSNGWVEIHSAPVSTSDANLFIDAWSGDYYYFTNQKVKIAFKNFIINQGQLICPNVRANIDIKPDTLNKASKGGTVTAYIEVPDHDVNAIDVSTVRLSTHNGMVSAQITPTRVGDYDGDNIPDMMVKFDRQAVLGIVDTGENKVTVSGKIAGELFEGTDEIRVIS